MKVSDHVINAGGKRMRPLMTLLISRMIKDEQYQPSLELGAITEMLHTATLVHDDVIDQSGMRRGDRPPTPLGTTPRLYWWATILSLARSTF